MSALEEIKKIIHQLPEPVSRDINQRINDWLTSGGQDEDPYIEQQLQFVKRFVENKNSKGDM